MKHKNIWIVVDHPNQIINAIGLSIYLKKFKSVNLLISKHKYWSNSSILFIKQFFNSTYIFPKIEFSKNFINEYFKFFIIRQKLKKISVNKKDIFLVLSDNVILEVVLIKFFTKNIRYKLLNKSTNEKFKSVLKSSYAKEKLISIIWKFMFFKLFNLKVLMYYQDKNDPKMFAVVFENNISELFNKVLCFNDNILEKFDVNEIPSLLPYVGKKIYSIHKKQEEKIIFFGSSLHRHNLYQIKFTNKCLRYIEKYFPNAKYFYKPHPHDKVEHKFISLGRFKLYNGLESTEILMINGKNDFTHYFSISLTSILTIINMGYVNAYVFFPLYKDYSKDFLKIIQRAYEPIKTKKAIFIDSFKIAPLKYVSVYNSKSMSKQLKHLNKKLLTADN